jgi:hypothetical protein
MTGDQSPARTAEHQPERYQSGLPNKVRCVVWQEELSMGQEAVSLL